MKHEEDLLQAIDVMMSKYDIDYKSYRWRNPFIVHINILHKKTYSLHEIDIKNIEDIKWLDKYLQENKSDYLTKSEQKIDHIHIFPRPYRTPTVSE